MSAKRRAPPQALYSCKIPGKQQDGERKSPARAENWEPWRKGGLEKRGERKVSFTEKTYTAQA